MTEDERDAIMQQIVGLVDPDTKADEDLMVAAVEAKSRELGAKVRPSYSDNWDISPNTGEKYFLVDETEERQMLCGFYVEVDEQLYVISRWGPMGEVVWYTSEVEDEIDEAFEQLGVTRR